MSDDKFGVRKARQADYIFWLRKEDWDPVTASILLAGYEPEEFPDGDSSYPSLASDADGVHRLIIEGINSKKLSVRNSPANWIAWLKQTGHPVPSELDAVLLRQNDQAPPAAPVVTAGASAGVGDWRNAVRAEAWEQWVKTLAENGTPTLENVSNHLAHWCDAKGIKTGTGISPKASYLKIHVIDGKHWAPPRNMSREAAKEHLEQKEHEKQVN